MDAEREAPASRHCLVDGHEELIPALALPDANDRHVLAAAIRGQADVIVTYNHHDVPDSALSRYGIEAQHLDAFVSHLIDVDAGKVLAAVREQRAALMRPPVDAFAFVERLEARELTQTGAFLRASLRSTSPVTVRWHPRRSFGEGDQAVATMQAPRTLRRLRRTGPRRRNAARTADPRFRAARTRLRR